MVPESVTLNYNLIDFTPNIFAVTENIDYVIPGNDDALRSINLYKNYFMETIQDAINFQDNPINEKINNLEENSNKE